MAGRRRQPELKTLDVDPFADFFTETVSARPAAADAVKAADPFESKLFGRAEPATTDLGQETSAVTAAGLGRATNTIAEEIVEDPFDNLPAETSSARPRPGSRDRASSPFSGRSQAVDELAPLEGGLSGVGQPQLKTVEADSFDNFVTPVGGSSYSTSPPATEGAAAPLGGSRAGRRQPQLKMVESDPFASFFKDTPSAQPPAAAEVPVAVPSSNSLLVSSPGTQEGPASVAGGQQPQPNLAGPGSINYFFEDNASLHASAVSKAEDIGPYVNSQSTLVAADRAPAQTGGRQQPQLKMAEGDPFANLSSETASSHSQVPPQAGAFGGSLLASSPATKEASASQGAGAEESFAVSSTATLEQASAPLGGSVAGRRQPQLKMVEGDPFANFFTETASSYVPSAAVQKDADHATVSTKETASSYVPSAVEVQGTSSLVAEQASAPVGGRQQPQLKMMEGDPFANFSQDTATSYVPSAAEVKSVGPSGSSTLAPGTEQASVAVDGSVAGRRQPKLKMMDGDPFANLSTETAGSYVPSAAGRRQPKLKMVDGDPFADFFKETASSHPPAAPEAPIPGPSGSLPSASTTEQASAPVSSYVPSATGVKDTNPSAVEQASGQVGGRRQPQLKMVEGDPFANFFQETASSRRPAAGDVQVTGGSSPSASRTEGSSAPVGENAGSRHQPQLKMADGDPFASFFPDTANSQLAAKADGKDADPSRSLPLAASRIEEVPAASAPVDEVVEEVEEVEELEQVGVAKSAGPSSSSLIASSPAAAKAGADADATGAGRGVLHENVDGEHHDHQNHHDQRQGPAQDDAAEEDTEIMKDSAAPGWSPTDVRVQEAAKQERSAPGSKSSESLAQHGMREEMPAAQENAPAPGWSPSIVLAQDQEKNVRVAEQIGKPAPHLIQEGQQVSEQIASKSAKTPISAAALDGMDTTLPLSMWWGTGAEQGPRDVATPRRAAEEPENLDMKAFIAKLEHDLEMRQKARESQQAKDRAREEQHAQLEKERSQSMEPASSSTRRRSSSAGPRTEKQRPRREVSSSMRQGNLTERTTHPGPESQPESQPRRPLGAPPPGRPRMQSRMPAHLISWKPPNPEDMLTPKELGQKAQQELTRRVQVALQNSKVTPVLGPESLQPELQSILAKESNKAARLGLKQEMLRVKTINDTIEKQAKLQEWYAQKEAAQEMELARQMAVREEQRRLVEAEERKRQRRYRELQRQLADWAVQKEQQSARGEEAVQHPSRPVWV